jgi:hypothetical protein
MITKSDWQSVHEKMLAEDRARLGEPPTAEELFAYEQGELSAAEEERIRALLVCYPELARTFAVPFPTDDAGPDDPDFLSKEALAERWTSLQRHVRGDDVQAPPANVAVFPARADIGALRLWRRTSAALAAALVLTFGALLWKDQRILAPAASMPAIVDEVQIEEGGSRGGADQGGTLRIAGDSVRLRLRLARTPAFVHYRLELVDLDSLSQRPLWTAATELGEDEAAFHVDVPRTFLKPGRYRINVYGIDGNKEQIEGVFTIRVPAP